MTFVLSDHPNCSESPHPHVLSYDNHLSLAGFLIRMEPLGKIKLELLEILGSSLLESLLANYQACAFLTEDK